MRILVTGGAGFIGSFMVNRLISDNHSVVVADNLIRSNKDAINPDAVFLEGDLLDRSFLAEVFKNQKFDAVIHFAGFISMGESMKNPYIYFQNNIFSSLNIMEEMVKTGDFKCFISLI